MESAVLEPIVSEPVIKGGNTQVEVSMEPAEPVLETPPVAETPPAEEETTPQGDENPFQAFTNEFAETGELSEESYGALKEQGLGRDVVDTYIKGQQAMAAEAEVEAYAAVGGKETYGKMTAWAEKGLSTEEVSKFNASIESKDPTATGMAMEYLKAKYDAAQVATPRSPEGKFLPRRVVGAAPAAPRGVQGFGSEDEFKAAFSDPRYKTSPAYREEVAKRASKTN
jgi:hypothetical protein